MNDQTKTENVSTHCHYGKRRMLKPAAKPTRQELHRTLLQAREKIDNSILEMILVGGNYPENAPIHQEEARSLACEAQALLMKFNEGAKL